MEGTSATPEETKWEKPNTIFVAGSTGKTGKRIVEQLLSKSFGVRAGARDLEKARSSLPQHPNLQIVCNIILLWALISSIDDALFLINFLMLGR